VPHAVDTAISETGLFRASCRETAYSGRFLEVCSSVPGEPCSESLLKLGVREGPMPGLCVPGYHEGASHLDIFALGQLCVP
jgi:hypothetical protein